MSYSARAALLRVEPPPWGYYLFLIVRLIIVFIVFFRSGYSACVLACHDRLDICDELMCEATKGPLFYAIDIASLSWFVMFFQYTAFVAPAV